MWIILGRLRLRYALTESLSLSPMRPAGAAALVYLASVARVAAIEYGYPPVKSTSSFIDVNPVSVGDGILIQFEKKIQFGKPDF